MSYCEKSKTSKHFILCEPDCLETCNYTGLLHQLRWDCPVNEQVQFSSCTTREIYGGWEAECLPRGQCYKTFSVSDLQIFVLSKRVSQTRPEKLTYDKPSSLLEKSEIYRQKKFYNIWPRCVR